MSDDDEDLNVNLENGHYSSGDHTANSDSDTPEELEVEEEPAGPTSTFDTNLPTTHKYLGKLENISGYTLYDEGQIIDMLAMYTNTLVFPGFTLPLVIRGDFEVENIYEDFKNGYTFVLTCLNHEGNDLFDFGVVMEVFENCFKRGSVTLKAKGRQRCRILPGQSFSPSWGRLSRVKVQILPDPPLSTPISDTQLLTLKKRRRFNLDYEEYAKFNRFRKYHLAQYPFPGWVYDQYEIDYYMKHMLIGLAQYYVKDCIPKDPTALSYWFVQNFQLGHNERLKILASNTTLERLQRELKYLNLERLICCGRCGVDIANQNKVFPMSKDGVQSNYVNPGGVVYETVTVTTARHFILDGSPSKQFSWFPGYAWTIMKCALCKSHLGWQFTSKQLQPFIFFGLAHSCLKIKIVRTEGEDTSDDECDCTMPHVATHIGTSTLSNLTHPRGEGSGPGHPD